eukprot:scaffold440015_cov34-Prasinocladus_malaysianus.AAC.1
MDTGRDGNMDIVIVFPDSHCFVQLIYMVPDGVAICRSLETVAIAGTAMHHHDCSSWIFDTAPEPKVIHVTSRAHTYILTAP